MNLLELEVQVTELSDQVARLEEENIRLASLMAAVGVLLATAKLVSDPEELGRLAQQLEGPLRQAREDYRNEHKIILDP